MPANQSNARRYLTFSVAATEEAPLPAESSVSTATGCQPEQVEKWNRRPPTWFRIRRNYGRLSRSDGPSDDAAKPVALLRNPTFELPGRVAQNACRGRHFPEPVENDVPGSRLAFVWPTSATLHKSITSGAVSYLKRTLAHEGTNPHLNVPSTRWGAFFRPVSPSVRERATAYIGMVGATLYRGTRSSARTSSTSKIFARSLVLELEL